MTTRDERLLENQIRGIPKKAPIKRFGLTGYSVKGVVRVVVYKDPSRVWVRFPDGTVVKALHNGKVDDQPSRPVSVYEDEKEGWKIEGINSFEAGGSIYQGGTGQLMPPHLHTASDITDLADVAVTHAAIGDTGLVLKTGPTTYEVIKITSTNADPDVTDDTTQGYSVFSFWLNTDTGIIWDCLDPAEGAAVWVQRGSGSGGGGSSLSIGSVASGSRKIGADGAEIFTQVSLTPNVAVIPLENTIIAELIGLRIYNRYGVTRIITNVFAAVDTPPDGADIIIDVLKNGVSIFDSPADMPTILDGQNTGETTTFDENTWGTNEYLQIEILQAGSTTPGADLTIHIAYT